MNAHSPIVSEFASAEDQAAYEAWLADKVAASLADDLPVVAHDAVIGEMRAIIDRNRPPRAAC